MRSGIFLAVVGVENAGRGGNCFGNIEYSTGVSCVGGDHLDKKRPNLRDIVGLYSLADFIFHGLIIRGKIARSVYNLIT